MTTPKMNHLMVWEVIRDTVDFAVVAVPDAAVPISPFTSVKAPSAYGYCRKP